MWKSVRYYLGVLIKDGHEWQNIDISGKIRKTPLFFSCIQWILIVLSTIMAFYSNALKSDFIGFLITALSICIALFLQLVVSIYTKFGDIMEKIAKESEVEKIFAIQYKNFSKQFTAIISYSILIAIFCVLLLTLLMGIDELNSKSLYYNISMCIIDDIKLSLIHISSYLIKVILFYFLLDFCYLFTYGISAFYNFMRTDYNRVTIK